MLGVLASEIRDTPCLYSRGVPVLVASVCAGHHGVLCSHGVSCGVAGVSLDQGESHVVYVRAELRCGPL